MLSLSAFWVKSGQKLPNQAFDRILRQIYDARPMDVGITAEIDPLLLAKEGRRVSGELPLSDLPRLAALSTDPSSGQVSAELQFSQDEDRKCWMQGSVSGQLEVTCQRCLEPLSLTLESKINAMLVRQSGDAADTQESGDEESVACKGLTTVSSLIEDDLLLAMPMFPKHETGECSNEQHSYKSIDTNNRQEDEQRDSPFAILATLKSGKRKG